MGDTYKYREVTSSCSDIKADTETKCETYKDSELLLQSHFPSVGLCVNTMASKCSPWLEQSTQKCKDKRYPRNKTVNFIVTDYYESYHSGQNDHNGNSCNWCGDVVKVAEKMNEANINKF